MKKFKNILFLILLISYLSVLSGFINIRENQVRIQSLQIHIKDSTDYQFIDKEDLKNMLAHNDFQLIGKPVKDVGLEKIEGQLKKHQIIKEAEVYITEPGILHLDIIQKKPFIRIINQTGQGYYLDREGSIIPLSASFSPFVMVASGAINEPFKINQITNIFEISYETLPSGQRVLYDLYKLAIFIDGDDLWESQIEQIFVDKNYDFKLVPRVGPHIIEFGKAENIEEKFENLKLLYTQGFNNLGWNQYIHINLKYKNQVICTKI